MNRKWLTLGLAFASGAALGVAASWTWLEDRSNRKYQAWVTTRITTEDHVRIMREKREATPLEEIKAEMAADVAAYEEVVSPYVSTLGPLGSSEFELISDDEYGGPNDEFDKITIEIYRDDLQYQLVVDGETVIDWRDILTPVIIEELKGKDHLMLRNNTKGEDYLITWGQP